MFSNWLISISSSFFASVFSFLSFNFFLFCFFLFCHRCHPQREEKNLSTHLKKNITSYLLLLFHLRHTIRNINFMFFWIKNEICNFCDVCFFTLDKKLDEDYESEGRSEFAFTNCNSRIYGKLMLIFIILWICLLIEDFRKFNNASSSSLASIVNLIF